MLIPSRPLLLITIRGISYTLFFGLFSNILRWSYGYNLLQRSAEDDDTIVDNNSSDYGSVNDNSRRSSSATVSDQRKDLEINRTDSSMHKKSDETTNLLDQKQESKERTFTCRSIKFLKSIDKYMSPPLYAALLALFVGLCPPIKRLMYNPESFFYASLTKAIESCGKASVPIVLVCLGAQLKSIRETQHASSPKHRQPVSLSIFIRMVLTPLCVLPLVYAFAKYGSKWSELANDPMFIVSMIVVGCTPTAINLAQITQVSGIFEEEMLNVLFWSYGVICIPVCTFVVFLALYMVSSMN
jgi:predicted permease